VYRVQDDLDPGALFLVDLDVIVNALVSSAGAWLSADPRASRPRSTAWRDAFARASA
jgi:hypothetical protein